MPTVVQNTFVLNAGGLVNVLTHLLMNGNENVIDKKKVAQISSERQQAQAQNHFDLKMQRFEFL